MTLAANPSQEIQPGIPPLADPSHSSNVISEVQAAAETAPSDADAIETARIARGIVDSYMQSTSGLRAADRVRRTGAVRNRQAVAGARIARLLRDTGASDIDEC